jgi:hypothetical protein
MRVEELTKQVLRVGIVQAALQLFSGGPDNGRLPREGRAIGREIAGLVAAKQDVFPLLDLFLECDLHDAGLVVLAHLGVESLEGLTYMEEQPYEHNGTDDETEAAEGDDPVQALRDRGATDGCGRKALA